MQRERGFTLVELLVVFAIMALLIGVMPVMYERMQEASQYRNTVRTMLSLLRTARYDAQTQGRETRFFVDLNQHLYGLDDANGTAYPDTLQISATVAATDLSSAGQAAIRFLPSGGSTGGSIDIQRPHGGGTRLRVDWLTGRIVQEPLQP
ncbi:type II secretion system protein [Extensimonas sp. H3M7-6]|jgi:general secretion pathway protein H|uniref:type II secretion system protein n=1 Tax=Extensimonas soli TaxID=3031322 RepID=UPI0023D9F3ED|nr:type II secretion system protein [Extensimonas sp. H3M7-6]MDF1482623.1 type II secretion system protein [Extensimonas sp. H3M7-6]